MMIFYGLLFYELGLFLYHSYVFRSVVYAMVHEFNDECETIDISFPTFYPYNYGKDVCEGLDGSGECIGKGSKA